MTESGVQPDNLNFLFNSDFRLSYREHSPNFNIIFIKSLVFIFILRPHKTKCLTQRPHMNRFLQASPNIGRNISICSVLTWKMMLVFINQVNQQCKYWTKIVSHKIIQEIYADKIWWVSSQYHHEFLSRYKCNTLYIFYRSTSWECCTCFIFYFSTIIIVKFVDFQKLIYKISLYGRDQACWMNSKAYKLNFSPSWK